MKLIDNLKPIITTILLAALLIPTMHQCAALPEETEMPQIEQEALNQHLVAAAYVNDKTHIQ